MCLDPEDFRGIVTRRRSMPKTIPYTPDEVERTHGLSAVLYEMQQYCICMNWLRELADLSLQNALVESMLIHVRALQDFFEATSRRTWRGIEHDDILSSDFGFPARPLALPTDYRSRINTELAHLSYTRA